MDGFAFIFAPLDRGKLITKPLRFNGDTLILNFSTSAAGSIRVEVQNLKGEPIKGYALDECAEIIGDAIDYPVRWRGGTSIRPLAENPVRLRFVLRDVDLYALRFTPRLL